MRVTIQNVTEHNIVLPDSVVVAGQKSTMMYHHEYRRAYVIYSQDKENPDWTIGVDTEGYDGKVEVSGCVRILDEDDEYCGKFLTEVYCKAIPIDDLARGINEAAKAIEEDEDSVLNKQ